MESIRIGDDIEIRILTIKGNQVRIGIYAPKEIPVHRDEVYKRIKERFPLGLKEVSNK